MTATFTDAAKTGYQSIWRGIKTYVRGWWLQLSRGLIAFAWVFAAGFVGGVVTEMVGAGVGLAVAITTFLCLPVAYGYWKVNGATEGEE